jgi:hypothetical protein|tara:strand:+ start:3367 stop:3591 length:225 start_codon:yes stop_codon:yes gene_type:complete
MLRTEMVDNLLDSYTLRELEALGKKLGVLYKKPDGYFNHGDMISLADALHDILFDPCGSYHEFNKLTEANDEPA